MFWTPRSGYFGKIMIPLNSSIKITYMHVVSSHFNRFFDDFLKLETGRTLFPCVPLYVSHLFQRLFSHRKIRF